jgi:prepilin-type N-terminal cleavage/methylation domain-containing protein
MQHARGFSLLEVLVATTIVVVGIAALAQLFGIATRANSSAKTTTVATVLAQQKMEQLRSLTWAFDASGAPISDTTTDITTEPDRPFAGTGLSPSPDGTLSGNVVGYCDFVDRNANALGGGAAPPAATAYIRRWSVRPLSADPEDSIVLQVLVMHRRSRGALDAGDTTRLPDEAYLVSVKTRKAS